MEENIITKASGFKAQLAAKKTAEIDHKKKIQNWLQTDKLKKQINQVFGNDDRATRFLRGFLVCVQKNPKLLLCSQSSLYSNMMTCANYNIVPDGRKAHLIPFKSSKNSSVEATLVIDYKGLVELILRSQRILNIMTELVCTEDEFEYNIGEVTCHKIDFKKPRGDIYAVYAMAKLKGGATLSAVMSKEEVDKIRRFSNGKDGTFWQNWYGEMAKKTALRRLSKMLPLTDEVSSLIEKDDENHFERKGQGLEPNKGMLFEDIEDDDSTDKAIDL